MTGGLRVTDGGLMSTIQDFGRFGYQRFGLSAAGAMDRRAMVLANALVGNPRDASVIETTLIGPTLVVEAEACRVAHTGMPAVVTLNGDAVPNWRSLALRRGDRIAMAAGASGLRGYLAVAGGFAIEPVLGSTATHVRSAIGGLDGRALRAGDLIPLAAPAVEGSPRALPEAERPPRSDIVRVVLGPQDDAFTPAGVETFLSSAYTVSNRTDRMGCELDGPVIAHAAGFNIVSDGIMNGSIQVPGHGRPVVLLADRQTTGGYPKIATVVEPDLGVLAQMRPGDALRFLSVDTDEAEAIAVAFARETERMIAAIRDAAPAAQRVDPARLFEANLISGVVRG